MSRKIPASAITNFMEIDENRILFIGYEIYTRNIFSSVMIFIKIGLFNNINNKEISIKIKLP
jgi:hypothetical protein